MIPDNTKKNPIIFYFLFILLSFYFIGYNFFIPHFTLLENEQNQNNINTVLSKMNTAIENIKNITNDYSKWDDTFNFINGLNKDYIYDNFREGTKTLEDLNVDFIIYSNLKQKTIFSKYSTDLPEIDKKLFEKEIFKRFEYETVLNTIFKYKSYYFYLIKAEIFKSDLTGKTNGHIYSGKIIDDEELKRISNVFEEIHISNEYSKKNGLKIKHEHLKNVKVKISYKNSYINSNIQFYDDENNYIFSIITKNNRSIVKKGKETVIIYNLIILIFLLIIFYIIYKNKIILEKYNKLLELKVKRRTGQLARTLRKLQEKNKELFTLAHKDYLTNIDNRRSFFIQGEKALKNSIQNNSQFSVLMMDIDNFKKINDSYGHSIGDKILIEFCNIVNKIIDKNTIFGRIGGEEFCILFMNISIEEAYKTGENIRRKCEDTIINIDNKKINFTVSFGLSERENITNIDKIIQQSDELLYEAKESGRNCIIRTSPH